MFIYPKKYEVIVIGGGHAGCEAALAASRMGHQTLLLTINLDNIAQMSCNPAIGGLAKGHLAREIDALGGEMAKNIDATGIQFRMLNKRKGPAVWAPRAQADKKAYQFRMKAVLEGQENLDVKQEIVEEVLVSGSKVDGVWTQTKTIYKARTVILTAGTFLQGLIHIGEFKCSAGRAGEFAAQNLSTNLRNLGFEVRRLKTGTPPRVNKRSIDFSQLQMQKGDEHPQPFSFANSKITQSQIPCYLTYTNKKAHQLILENIKRVPLYNGQINSTGPRYCPSIESKVVRFPHKHKHQVFLEPEGRDTEEIYLNGLATSLPMDIQIAVLKCIKGLENVEMMRPGYAIEYDFCPPTQLKPSLESKIIKNLFFAGQINGTSGYEEAAGQGIIAGINAVLKLQGKKALILGRDEAYIGVLIDDLITKGTDEPYRMFTSRAEYRLLLRQDNADLRLMKYGYKAGLISQQIYQCVKKKEILIKQEIKRLKQKRIGDKSLAELLRQPEKSYQDIPSAIDFPDDAIRHIELTIKYEGYIKRQLTQVAKFRQLESKAIPADFNYCGIQGLKAEAQEKLDRIRPVCLGQAARISGVSPADISLLMIRLKSYKLQVASCKQEATGCKLQATSFKQET
ncbi:MAG: tRNA uridine-5-carboxymethylaminomethyl(34) synthesis enzyme MnmG [Candidatus Omnitrophica bacterium]|nr:tRNA uridine-5-carboxymethylaminomethyl(34) synthesis enzyme MnmG [Candidatus Omnitrophota bacterium]